MTRRRSLGEAIKEGLKAPITDEDRAWTREQIARLADDNSDEPETRIQFRLFPNRTAGMTHKYLRVGCRRHES